jgi:4-hydroxyphenylpyruvate dioxygenase
MSEREGTPGLGIVGWDALHCIVADLDRSRRFHTEMMSVPELARLEPRHAADQGEEAALFGIGRARMICVAPMKADSRAGRWLKRHPDGVAILSLRVRDAQAARDVLAQRGATLITGVVSEPDQRGRPFRYCEIATPLGDVRLRFVERAADALPPGFVPAQPAETANPLGFQVVDHVTSNMLTIEPWITWLRDVLGFEEYWRVRFHTSDMRGGNGGSGLFSVVMWDPESGVKLANNEPAAPNFEASQIYAFVEANRGAGVQHVAFHVPEIVRTVEGLRERGIAFLDTPGTYYDLLPARLSRHNVTNLAEDLDQVRRLGILVDGADDRYLLQIFMVEGGLLYGDESAGPLFYEVIQRRGARGFGEGNFRALFEAIERDQERRALVQEQYRAGAGS